jgi:hypothetical protein
MLEPRIASVVKEGGADVISKLGQTERTAARGTSANVASENTGGRLEGPETDIFHKTNRPQEAPAKPTEGN